MCAGLYPHDRSPANSATGITWMQLTPSFFRWSNRWITLSKVAGLSSSGFGSLNVPTCSSYTTHSFHPGVLWNSSPQSKFGSWTTPLPTELVTSRAYGSIFDSSPTAVWRTNRYSAPTAAPGTSTYQ